MKQPPLFDTDSVSGAEFSECRVYRYALWRRWRWRETSELVMFIGLNPSTADETENDPTIRRCIRFAKDWGYDGLLMMNAYGFRATDPRVMKAADDPVGPGNDTAFANRRRQAALIVAAWGVHCSPERARRVCDVLDRPVHCLGTTKSGAPKHPLYLPASSTPVLWQPRS